ncbi:MAG: tetratricopeptide repeat protein, partial [Planctomycetota bacterium]
TENYGFDKIVAMLGKYGEGKLTEPIFREVLDISLEEFDEGFFAYAREFAESFGIQPRIPLGKVDEFKYYAEDNPEEIDGLVRLGFAYYFNGRETDAELAAGRAKRLEKPSADLQALLGLIKLAQGRAQPVVRHLQAALDQGTKYKYRSLVGIGTVHYSRNNMEKAIDFLQPAIELHPTGTRRRFGSRESPYYMLINAYLELERSEDALRVMEKLVDIDRDDRTARMRLLRHYVEKEEWAKALRYAEDIVFIDPYEPTFHDQLAQAYLGLDRFAECQRELEILLATPEPNLERISADLAWCYHQGGKREKAVEWARKALEFDPEEPRAREILDAK